MYTAWVNSMLGVIMEMQKVNKVYVNIYYIIWECLHDSDIFLRIGVFKLNA